MAEAEQLAAAYKDRKSAKSCITRIGNFLESNKDTLLNEFEYLNRLEILEKAYQKLCLAQDVIDDLETDPQRVGDIVDAENKCCSFKADISTILKTKFANSTQGNNVVVQASDTVSSQFSAQPSVTRMPEIHIDKFSGDQSLWDSFFEIFNAVVMNNKDLADVQKLIYLKLYLVGEPLKLIESLALIGSNLEVAVKILKERYDNKLAVIYSHIKGITDIPSMTKFTSTYLRDFVVKVKQHTECLKNLKVPIEHWDLILVYILSHKLDINSRRSYELERGPTNMPTLIDFLRFVEKRCQAAENVSTVTVDHSPKVSRKYSHVVQEDFSCMYCKMTNHSLIKCLKFKALTVVQRRRFVFDKKLCFKCFKSHSAAQCTMSNCSACGQAHNILVHFDNNKSGDSRVSNFRGFSQNSSNNVQPNGTNVSLATQSSSNDMTHCNRDENITEIDEVRLGTTLLARKSTYVLLATALVNIIDEKGNVVQARAILDNGSQVSLITQNLVKKLGCSTHNLQVAVRGIGGNINCQKAVNLTIASRVNGERKFVVNCTVVDRITGKLPQFLIDQNNLDIPDNVILADPAFFQAGNVDILLGADLYFNLILPGLISLGSHRPMIQNTHLGWVLGGQISEQFVSNLALSELSGVENFSVERVFEPTSLFINTGQIDEYLKRFWSLEEVSTERIPCEEEELSEQLFQDTTVLLPCGRFQVNIPFKNPSDYNKLGESFSTAKRQFLLLERKLHKNLDLFNQYKNFIEEYVKLGHARFIDFALKNDQGDHRYFIPHHCVVRTEKITTKLRVVFNASMKTTSGYSLNDICLKGYVVQPELFDILCRFRTFKHVLVTDIEKMYRQILVNPDQCYLQNIIWRDNPDKDLQIVELLTVSYGTNFAPFVSTRCLLQLAESNKAKFPLASDVIKTQTYMDDVLCGADTLDELSVLQYQLTELLKLGGFSLHKWMSNSVDFMRTISYQSDSVNYIIHCEENSSKVLGINWNCKLDSFTITLPKQLSVEPLTKRTVLSIIAQIYDPLGFVGPFVVKAKIFIQHLWSAKLSWDKPLSPALAEEWRSFSENIFELKDIKIPRSLFNYNLTVSKIEIHGYADASTKAYGCCLYLRVIYNNNFSECNLICSKSRVAPLRTVSLPRLELCACLLLGQLIHKILQIYDKSTISISSVNLWTDSQIALAWIDSHPSRWNIFVANRVAQIQKLTAGAVWRHVKTTDNPADYVSRGVTANKLVSSEMWWHGPCYLQNPAFNLDSLTLKLKCTGLPEEKKTTLLAVDEDYPIDSFNKFSDFVKLQRVTAHCLRFVSNCKLKSRLSGPLTINEMQAAKLAIIKSVQRKYFSSEIDILKNNQLLSNKQLRRLNPFLDKDNILRVGGRLRNAELSFSQKFPILLPSKDHVVDMLLRREHVRLYHAGPQTVLSNFRLEFWPLNGLRTVKRIIHKCIICFRFRAKGTEQIMADLPRDRVSLIRPFLCVGVDFGGPFYIKASTLRRAPKIKVYIAIFVCMATKSVHIELVSGLSTESFLLTLKRFVARRGNPSVIYSDNATNFSGSSNYLKELYDFFKNKGNLETVSNFLSKNQTEWKFIPPRSPHWGGLWEAAIKSAKHHILRAVGNLVLNFEEFATVLTTVESILNSRPLTSLSNDPNDLNPLTPGHFLIGESLTAFPEKNILEVPDNRLSNYQKCEKIKQQFWKRWSVEYLNRLQQRPKWLTPSRDLKVNQIVLVKDDNLPPLKWSLARIIEVCPSSDGRVRVARIITECGTFIRSVSKLCPLPFDDCLVKD